MFPISPFHIEGNHASKFLTTSKRAFPQLLFSKYLSCLFAADFSQVFSQRFQNHAFVAIKVSAKTHVSNRRKLFVVWKRGHAAISHQRSGKQTLFTDGKGFVYCESISCKQTYARDHMQHFSECICGCGSGNSCCLRRSCTEQRKRMLKRMTQAKC